MIKPITSQAIVEAPQSAPPIVLKDPLFAAFLAWLIPGAGHFYQGRTAKGILFATCILGTFFYGLFLGGGKVVYASWRSEDLRLAYLCQVGVGLPALPALVQTYRVNHGKPPLTEFMAPPNPVRPGEDDLATWHKNMGRYFELGTVYTMIAGLLNILAVYDAWGGPLQIEPESKSKDKEKEKDDNKEK